MPSEHSEIEDIVCEVKREKPESLAHVEHGCRSVLFCKLADFLYGDNCSADVARMGEDDHARRCRLKSVRDRSKAREKGLPVKGENVNLDSLSLDEVVEGPGHRIVLERGDVDMIAGLKV